MSLWLARLSQPKRPGEFKIDPVAAFKLMLISSYAFKLMLVSIASDFSSKERVLAMEPQGAAGQLRSVGASAQLLACVAVDSVALDRHLQL